MGGKNTGISDNAQRSHFSVMVQTTFRSAKNHKAIRAELRGPLMERTTRIAGF